MTKRTTIIIACLLITVFSYGQKRGQARLDSLLAELPLQIDDTNKVKTLCRIGVEYYQIDPLEGINYGNQVLKLADTLKFRKGVADGYSILSCCFSAISNYPLALDYGFKCLKTFEEIKNNEGIANAYGMIGGSYSAQKDYDNAILYYSKALALERSEGRSGRLFLANIGTAYHDKGDFKQALFYMEKDLEVSRKEGNKVYETSAIGNIGGAYIKSGEFEKGLDYLKTSLTMSREIGNKLYESYSLRYLGKAYLMLANDTNSAALKQLYNGNKTLALKYSRAYSDSALTMAVAMGSIKHQSACYKVLSETQKLQGDFKAALESHEKYMQLNDSLFNKDNNDKLTRLRMQHEFDKKVAAENAKHEKEVAIAHAEVQKQRVIRNSSIAGTFGILMFVGFAFYNFQRRRHLEKMQALATERLRISRELHDDVGSALGSIALYSDVAISRSIKKESTGDVLLKIGNASRELVERMSDIIWSMNPDNENIDKLVTRMNGFGNSLLAPLRINIKSYFDPSLNKLHLTSDQMKNIFLVFKEAVYNIAKYAECRNVDISLKMEGNNILLSIKDDGKGFEYETAGNAYNGNGLKNMQARSVLLKGNIYIHSKPSEGTIVELLLPTVI